MMIPLCSISQAQTQAQALIFITHLLSLPLKQQNQSFNLSDQNKHSLLPFNWDNWVFIQDYEKAEWEKFQSFIIFRMDFNFVCR